MPIISSSHTVFEINDVTGIEVHGTFLRMYVGYDAEISTANWYFENITTSSTVPFVIFENYRPSIENVTFVNAHVGSTILYFFKDTWIMASGLNFKNVTKMQLDVDQLRDYEKKFLSLRGLSITVKRGFFFSLIDSKFIDIYSTAMY